ncbi:hypothetical protein VTI74DRAFT_5883 [Chaetomium olivicolor]
MELHRSKIQFPAWILVLIAVPLSTQPSSAAFKSPVPPSLTSRRRRGDYPISPFTAWYMESTMPSEEHPPRSSPSWSESRRFDTANESVIVSMSTQQTPRTPVTTQASVLMDPIPKSSPVQTQNTLSGSASTLYSSRAPDPARPGQGQGGHTAPNPNHGDTAPSSPEAMDKDIQDARDELAESMFVCPGSASSPRSTPSPERQSRNGQTRNTNHQRAPIIATPWDLHVRKAQLTLGQYHTVFPDAVAPVGNPIQQPNPSPYPQRLDDADFDDRESRDDLDGGDNRGVQPKHTREEEGWVMCDDAESSTKTRSRM